MEPLLVLEGPITVGAYHSTPVEGHHGTFKTYRRLAREVYWKGMKAKVCSFVAECSVCQQAK